MKQMNSIKKAAVLSAAVILASAIPVTAAAAGEDPQKHVITIESNSEVYAPEIPSVTVEQGGTFTFSIPDNTPNTLTDEDFGEYSVTFSNWRFSGTYEVVSGSVNSDGDSFDKTVVLKPTSDVHAIACFIEDNAAFRMVRVDTNSEAYVSSIDQGEVPRGETHTFTVPDNLNNFLRWEFSGDYEVVSGNVDSNGVSLDRTVVLRPLSSMSAFARFSEPKYDIGTATYDETHEPVAPFVGVTDTSKTSPKTGDSSSLWAVIILITSAAGLATVISCKKRTHK